MYEHIASAQPGKKSMLAFSLNGINSVDTCSWMMWLALIPKHLIAAFLVSFLNGWSLERISLLHTMQMLY